MAIWMEGAEGTSPGLRDVVGDLEGEESFGGGRLEDLGRVGGGGARGMK